MRALILPVALSLLAVGASAAPSKAELREAGELATLLAGRTPGTPVSCLPTMRQGQSRFFGNGTLIYGNTLRRDRTIWRNDPPGGCGAGSNRNMAFVTQRPSTQACKGDILQLFDPATRIPQGSCALGQFTPYTRAD